MKIRLSIPSTTSMTMRVRRAAQAAGSTASARRSCIGDRFPFNPRQPPIWARTADLKGRRAAPLPQESAITPSVPLPLSAFGRVGLAPQTGRGWLSQLEVQLAELLDRARDLVAGFE